MIGIGNSGAFGGGWTVQYLSRRATKSDEVDYFISKRHLHSLNGNWCMMSGYNRSLPLPWLASSESLGMVI